MHNHTIDKEEVKSILKENNLKLTKQRLSLLDIFLENENYVSAKYVYDKMAEIYEGISYDTIYRNLYTLYEINVLEETTFNGEKHYMISCSDHHHHHFICENCGMVKIIHYCPVETWQKEIPSAKINSHKIELYGLCSKCQKG